jgi:hypothetical protein
MFKEGSSGNLGNAETKFGRHMISIPPFGNHRSMAVTRNIGFFVDMSYYCDIFYIA